MRIHGFFILGLTALVALSTAMGYSMPVMFMLPVAVAYLWIRERHLYAFLLSSVFGLLPLLTARDAFMAVAFLFAAFSGVGLGLLMRRKASLGMGIAFVTVCLFLLNAGHSALFWQEYRAAWQSEMQAFSASVSEVKDAERTAPMLEALDWLAQHWLYLSFGMRFGFILLVSTVLVAPCTGRRRRKDWHRRPMSISAGCACRNSWSGRPSCSPGYGFWTVGGPTTLFGSLPGTARWPWRLCTG
jgi:hypothetical protein